MNDRLLLGMLLGAGVTLALAPVVLPPLARAARPGAKAALKTAIVAYYRGQEAMAELRELAEDAYAEAVVELMTEAQARQEATPTAAASATASAAAKAGADAEPAPKQA